MGKTQIFLAICIFCMMNGAFAKPNYRFFSNFEDVAKVTHKQAQYFWGETGDVLPPKKEGAKLYSDVESAVKEVFEAFQVLYPKESRYWVNHQNQTRPPWVVIFKGDEFEAGVLGELNQRFYALSLSEKLARGNKKALYGIVAHELVHLLLQWSDPVTDFPHPRVEYYFSKNMNAPLVGVEKEQMDLWMDYTHYVGPFSTSMLKGIPFHYSADAISDEIFLKHLLARKNSRSCQEARQLYRQLRVELMASLSPSFDAIGIEKTNLRFALRRNLFISKAKVCLPQSAYSYTDLNVEVYDIQDPDFISEKIAKSALYDPVVHKTFEAVQKIYDENPVMEALFKSGEYVRKKMREIESKIDISQIRVLSDEDHADVVAVRILRHLDINIKAFNDYLIAEEKCDLDSNEEPPYGSPSDEHHSGCWRRWRNNLIWKQL